MSFRISTADRRQALELVLLDTAERLTRDLAQMRARGSDRAHANVIAMIEAWRSRVRDLRDDVKHGRIACEIDREHGPPKRSR